MHGPTRSVWADPARLALQAENSVSEQPGAARHFDQASGVGGRFALTEQRTSIFLENRPGPAGSEVYFCASFLAQTKKER
jgi:hypothetical protein